jgi:hypothetical protein
MTWLVPKLDKRTDICKPIQIPDSAGGFDTTFEVIVSLWSNLSTIKNSPFLNIVRGMQNNQIATHIFLIRECAVRHLKLRSTEPTLNPIKSNYFIFLRQGSEESSTKGRRFAIREVIDFEERGEYYKISVEELNEEGTNY